MLSFKQGTKVTQPHVELAFCGVLFYTGIADVYAAFFNICNKVGMLFKEELKIEFASGSIGSFQLSIRAEHKECGI